MSIEIVKSLFKAARENPKHPMNKPRLMGRHCAAVLKRGIAKRVARNKTPYTP